MLFIISAKRLHARTNNNGLSAIKQLALPKGNLQYSLMHMKQVHCNLRDSVVYFQVLVCQLGHGHYRGLKQTRQSPLIKQQCLSSQLQKLFLALASQLIMHKRGIPGSCHEKQSNTAICT